MTEEEAVAWLKHDLGVSRETMERLDALRGLVLAENERQNLIGAASIPHFWARHIVDSAQLLPHLWQEKQDDAWLDLGTGAGFPGLVVALLRNAPVHLVEARRRRHEFLREVVAQLGMDHVTVHGCRVESLLLPPMGVISARAFAPMPKLLQLGSRFSRNGTVWLLPKGRSAKEEVESARVSWQGVFHVKQSITDPEAAIVVATGVRSKGRA
jgi:16S rRNA (guanine527-N7)-methyltransferase